MIKILKHQRFQIPNGLAIVAATVLLASSVVGFNANRGTHHSNQDNKRAMQADSAGTASISNAAEKKSQRLNIGSLLFRHR